jgi:hypothetical protein
MLKRIACGVVVCSFLMLWPVVSAVAEEGEARVVLMIEDLYVFPDKAEEFEELFKEMKTVFIAHAFPYPLGFYKMDDLRYVAVWRIRGTGGVDQLNAAWETTAIEWGEEASAQWIGKLYATMSHWQASLWYPRPDLSYMAENQTDEVKYIVQGNLRIKLGHQQEVEELVKEYIAVYAEHEVPHGWNTGEGSVGTEVPELGFFEWSASPGAFWMRSDADRTNEELSKKTEAIWQRMAPHIRGYDQVTGWYLEELSYNPEMAGDAEEE